MARLAVVLFPGHPAGIGRMSAYEAGRRISATWIKQCDAEGEPVKAKGPVALLPGERIVQEVQSPGFQAYRIVKRRNEPSGGAFLLGDFLLGAQEKVTRLQAEPELRKPVQTKYSQTAFSSPSSLHAAWTFIINLNVSFPVFSIRCNLPFMNLPTFCHK